MKRARLLLISLFNFCILVAQPTYQIKHYSVNDGMSQGIVQTIIQDKKGFLWFGTWNGLNKFDGYTFKNYKTSYKDGYILNTNRISQIAETKYGDIWCQAYDGRVYMFDNQTEKFIDILGSVAETMITNNYADHIYTLSKGISWITFQNECAAIRIDDQLCKQGKGITLYSSFKQNLKGDKIYTVFEDSEGDEWILTNKGFSIIGKKQVDSDFPFQYIKEADGIIYLVSQSDKLASYNFKTRQFKFIEIPYHVSMINEVKKFDSNTLLLATDNGLIIYKIKEKEFQLIDIRTSTQPSNVVQSVYQDHYKELWIFPQTTGVIRYNPSTEEMQHLFTPADEVIRYERKNKNVIFEDRQHTLWVLPPEGNLSYYDRENKELKPMLKDSNNPKSVFSPLVRFYTLDNQGNCWLTSTRGIYKLSFFPHTYNLVHIDNGFETRAFLCDNEKRLWVSSKAQMIRVYQPDGQLEGYLTPQGKISKDKQSFTSVYCFLEDHEGNIWIGTKENGIYLLKKKSPDSYSVQQFTHQPNMPYSLSGNSVYSIFQDSHKRIWIGCYGGGINLLTYNKDGKTEFIHSDNELKNYPTGYASKVRHISEAPGGVLLIGTTNGLLTFSNQFERPEEIKFYRNCCESGISTSLSGNDVMHTYTDKQKRTYIASFTGGISQIVSKNLLSNKIEFKTYTTDDGLASDLVQAMQEDQQGNLWILSENAISKFDAQRKTFENYGLNSLHQEFSFSEAAPVINARNQIVFGTDKGFIEISSKEMQKSSYIPPIVFTGLKVQRQSSVIAIDDLEELRLTPSQRNVTFQFAALDYVDSKEIRYAYRLKGLEEEWHDGDKNRSASYINLPNGKYKLQIKSTNSDGVWMDNIRTLSINVLPTFWETGWAWLLYVILFVLFTGSIVYVLFYIYRLRHQVDIEQQLSNIKLRFFTDISHELRTPLTLISSPVNEVLENEDLSATAREHLTVVQKNAERMLRLMNQILDFRKIQNQKMKVLVEKTDLIPLLEKVMINFRLIAEEKKINFRLESELKSIYAWIDRDKFEKIFFNLISNAFKYTPAEKAITIEVTKQTDKVTISVVDEGIGIEPTKLRTLFQRFETLAQQNMLQPSSGIGLSLVKEMVDMHHGTIKVTSEPEAGSRFMVTLPLQKEVFEQDSQVEFILNDSQSPTTHPDSSLQTEKRPEAEDKEDMENNAAPDTFTILVVEDNEELKAFLKNILSENYTVITAPNGKEGLQHAVDNIPDLIISDVMMPVMDGLEMIRKIKENNNICHIPIIVLSAKASLDDRIAGLEQGIDDYITKPFSATYLKTRIASLLRQRKSLQEIYMAKLTEGKEIAVAEALTPSQPQITPYDEQFMQKVMEFIEEQMDNAELTIDEFAEHLMLSRTIFYRKLKSIIGLTPVDFIREVRIKRAAQLIDSGEYNFSQVAYMTGFNDPKYFSKCFKKVVGITPSEYKEKNK